MLMFTAGKDMICRPELMTHGMSENVANLTIESVDDASHWILWEQPQKVNSKITEFLKVRCVRLH